MTDDEKRAWEITVKLAEKGDEAHLAALPWEESPDDFEAGVLHGIRAERARIFSHTDGPEAQEAAWQLYCATQGWAPDKHPAAKSSFCDGYGFGWCADKNNPARGCDVKLIEEAEERGAAKERARLRGLAVDGWWVVAELTCGPPRKEVLGSDSEWLCVKRKELEP
jgi:hypothetical protein